MTFQARLYRLRKARGISQEELAQAVGVSRQAVQKWEAGTSRPDMDNLAAIGHYFNASLDYLIMGISQEQSRKEGAYTQTPSAEWHYEYRSRRALWGLPLVHVNLGRGVYRARGVIAIGNIATGVVSLGLFSAGGLSLGCLSAGLLSFGGLASGLLAAFGGLAVGGLAAFGGMAHSLGLACGGVALGGRWALGGVAVAQQIAAGGAVYAPIAIGEHTSGEILFPTALHGPETSQAIRAAIEHTFPHTPEILKALFSSF